MNNEIQKKGNWFALVPIAVFLALYLGLIITFEYILKIEESYSKIPIIICFLAALLFACIQNRKNSFGRKIEIMGLGIGDKNIITMILIFLFAGIFGGVVGRTSAPSVAYFLLSIIPPRFSVAVLFVVSCFVSLAMGTSVGTISFITPIAIEVSTASGFSLPLCIGSVVGGAMFGDNLSFISDTTIAACGGQGCSMKDKFKQNFFIALPAAIISLILILVISFNIDIKSDIKNSYNLIQIIPYIIVLLCGVSGMNVFLVLIIGIVSGSAITLLTTDTGVIDLLVQMKDGAAGMFETSLVAILASALCALIRENGGFDVLLSATGKLFKGNKGGQLGIGLLVGIMDIATANNTVAIVMANPIAKEMSERYGITPQKTASILDTFSCIFQGILPYGAQMLVAISLAKISTFDVIPYLAYPFLLLLSSLFFIFIIKDKKQ